MLDIKLILENTTAMSPYSDRNGSMVAMPVL
jgi:hypothetical protein